MAIIRKTLSSSLYILILHTFAWSSEQHLEDSPARIIAQQNNALALALSIDQVKDLKKQATHLHNAFTIFDQLYERLTAVEEQLNNPQFTGNPNLLNRKQGLEEQLTSIRKNPGFLDELKKAQTIGDMIAEIIGPEEAEIRAQQTLREASVSQVGPMASSSLSRATFLHASHARRAPTRLLSFSDLPDEMLVPIINLLEGKDLLAAALSCKTLYRIIADDDYLLKKRSSLPEHRREMILYFAEPIKEIKNIYGSLLQAVVRTKGGIFFNPSYFELKQQITTNPTAESLNYQNSSLNLIPREIARMDQLESLLLSHNNLTWLPYEITQLPKDTTPTHYGYSWSSYSYPSHYALKYLYLSHNCLTRLPEEIGTLVGLRQLDVSHNLLETLPRSINDLTNLYELNIGYNRLSDCSHIYLWNKATDQKVHGTINAEHNRLSNPAALIKPAISPRFFQSQNYSYNQLTKLPSIQSASLNVSYNTLVELNLGDFNNHASVLEHLDVSHNKITALSNNRAIDYLLEMTKAVKALNLSHNRLTSLHAALVQAFGGLESLNLSYNNISSLPSNLLNKYYLSHIDLSHNQLYQFENAGSPSTNLQTLNLSHNNLNSVPRNIITDSMRHLDLSHNRIIITDTFRMIGYLGNLVSLNLSYNPLTKIPEEVKELKSLASLNLDATDLTEFPSVLIYLTSLSTLSLNANQLSQVHEAIIRLTNLGNLSLGHNKFTKFPEDIVDLQRLYTLDLSHNQIDTIPAEVTQLTHLNLFDMSGNPLKRVPVSVKRITAFKSDTL